MILNKVLVALCFQALCLSSVVQGSCSASGSLPPAHQILGFSWPLPQGRLCLWDCYSLSEALKSLCVTHPTNNKCWPGGCVLTPEHWARELCFLWGQDWMNRPHCLWIMPKTELGAPREAVHSVTWTVDILILHTGSHPPGARSVSVSPLQRHEVPVPPTPSQTLSPIAVSYPDLLPGCR